MPEITEPTFTSDVASWINDIARERADLPFSRAQVELRTRGSQKKRDLTLYSRENRLALTGEVKLPDSPDGRSPFQEALVMDAHSKADRAGVPYFFTWNVNRCVLWKTFEPGQSVIQRYIEHFPLPNPVRTRDELLHPRVQADIKQFLAQFLERTGAIITGAEPMAWLPLDERFILIWESALDPLARETLDAINNRYERDLRFRSNLDKWMRDDQGWTLSREEEILRDNLERAAKFSCYVLANKIIFYKALRRRFGRMPALRIPPSIQTGTELNRVLHAYFEQAISVSRDYQTVFRGDFGDQLPFLNDAAVESWRLLSTQTDAFDFTQINYEIIGQIFERLLRGDERHRFGQHYTRSEIVDLINAFCIRSHTAKLLDPACGGGTFLVRAYERLRALSGGELAHEQLLAQLYGLDISAYPVHLTTINLATRDLVQEANYPLVARSDFFALKPREAVFNIPRGKSRQLARLTTCQVDAVVGNPPYVRQEKIDEYYGKGYKKRLQRLSNQETPKANLSGRSDIFCYFFTHAFSFLLPEGYIGLLTSSAWLDTQYGFRLQKFLLENFKILAIFESSCEPWFTGARVTTVATIVQREDSASRRMDHNIKFVWLYKELSWLIGQAESEEARRSRLEGLRDRVEGLCSDEETEFWRVRVVNQGELYRLGCLSFGATGDEDEDLGDE